MNISNKESYDKIAKAFFGERKKAKISKFIIEFGKLVKQGQILDIDCGAGVPIGKYLARKKFKVTGIDISKELLKVAVKNVPYGKFYQADILNYKTNNKFAGIVAWDSLFHLKPTEHNKAFKKIRSLLQNGGYFLFTHGSTEGNIEAKMFGENFSYSSLGSKKTKKLLERMGFKIILWVIDEKPNNKGNHGHMVAIVKK